MKEASEIVLSFCIPTLNRGHTIGETVQSIISQATDKVEIVVVDGGSTDDTPEVIAKFQEHYPLLRYFRETATSTSSNLPSNRGFDRDCCRAVELARGKYCWLFTDDDLINPGAIPTVLDAARKDYAAMVVNAEVRSADLSKSLEAARLMFPENRVYTAADAERLFIDVGSYLSFVGAVVVKREIWNARQKEQYIGSGFIHVGVLFQAPILDEVLVIATPLVAIRYGNALYMRSSRYFEIWAFTWPRLIWSLSHFSDLAKSQVCRKEPWRRVRTLLQYRAVGAFSMREYQTLLRERLESPWEKLTARLVASCPGSLANFVATIYCYLFGHPGQFFVDLVKSPFYFGRAFAWPNFLKPKKLNTEPTV